MNSHPTPRSVAAVQLLAAVLIIVVAGCSLSVSIVESSSPAVMTGTEIDTGTSNREEYVRNHLKNHGVGKWVLRQDTFVLLIISRAQPPAGDPRPRR